MAQGRIKWYDPIKGAGFIVPDDGGEDVFVQEEALLGAEPVPGDRVTFAVEQTPGGPLAKQVGLITSASDAVTSGDDHIVVPVREERLTATTREVDLGDVLVHRRVETEPVATAIDVTRDEISVERVPVNRPVDEIPEIRAEDDMIIIPVVAEEVVTTKRLVLREELRITRRRVTEATPIHDSVRREVIDVEGRPAPGMIPTVEPTPEQAHARVPPDASRPDDNPSSDESPKR